MRTVYRLLLAVSLLMLTSAPGFAAEVSSVAARMSGTELFVTAAVKPDPKLIDHMNKGMSKEFSLYIDLFRVWNIWPDEFVTGKKLVRILNCDPIKREFVATSIEGNVHLEKRFRDLESMIGWALNISDIRLANVREFEPGKYFVKVTVESSIRKLPPVIGQVLFFVAEKEFSVSGNSAMFQINQK